MHKSPVSTGFPMVFSELSYNFWFFMGMIQRSNEPGPGSPGGPPRVRLLTAPESRNQPLPGPETGDRRPAMGHGEERAAKRRCDTGIYSDLMGFHRISWEFIW